MVQHDDHHRFQWIAGQLSVSLGDARTALSRATAVLLGDEAEDGIKAAEHALHELRGEIEELVPAPQEPAVPSDIRATVTVVHLGGDLKRLAELAQQIAEIAWSRHSKLPLPADIRSVVETMSGGVLALVQRAGQTAILESAAATHASAGLQRELGMVERQQRVLDEVLLSTDSPVDGSSAVDLALLGRCYESCARHAVSAARHVAILAS